MFYVQKGAVQRIVASQDEVEALKKQGYVQIDENGVPMTVESDADKLAAMMAAGEELKAGYDAMEKENTDLKAQVESLNQANAVLQKQVTDLTKQLSKAAG
ncbi:MAG: hypothetical protein P4N59_25240 [Negativicutes bacterium]|nr:hypothetical protein [Negativicutes bacterium]